MCTVRLLPKETSKRVKEGNRKNRETKRERGAQGKHVDRGRLPETVIAKEKERE